MPAEYWYYFNPDTKKVHRQDHEHYQASNSDWIKVGLHPSMRQAVDTAKKRMNLRDAVACENGCG